MRLSLSLSLSLCASSPLAGIDHLIDLRDLFDHFHRFAFELSEVNFTQTSEFVDGCVKFRVRLFNFYSLNAGPKPCKVLFRRYLSKLSNIGQTADLRK
jgi:hypothetical protein